MKRKIEPVVEKKPEPVKQRYLTDDLKQGMEVVLRNGWRGIVEDNKTGNYRKIKFTWQIPLTAKQIRYYKGEVCSFEIVGVKINNNLYPIQHTIRQKHQGVL